MAAILSPAAVGVIVKTHLITASIQEWLPLIGVAAAAALMASAAVAITADRRRVHYGRPVHADRTGRDQ